MAHIGETGVDEQTAMLFRYHNGALAQLSCAVRTKTPQHARIEGTRGSIHVPQFWHATHATLRVDGQEPLTVADRAGYQFEATEAMSCLRTAKTESDIMPLDESLAIARTMNEARRLIGLTYPMEG